MYPSYQSGQGNAKEGLCQSREAERWLKGGVGSITFEDACECLCVTPEVARAKILAYVHKHRRRSGNGALYW
jgi:hypothetical protein